MERACVPQSTRLDVREKFLKEKKRKKKKELEVTLCAIERYFNGL